MKECWYENPGARLTALRIKKTITYTVMEKMEVNSEMIINSQWGDIWKKSTHSKVSFFLRCSKMQLISLKKFKFQTCSFQFLWFCRLKCWFKGQIISKIHLRLPNAYKLMCFDRNINGNKDVKFFEWDYWSLHWRKNLTLVRS